MPEDPRDDQPRSEDGSADTTPPVWPPRSATIPQESVPDVGDSIGPYHLLEQIARGGFGVVYLAEQRQPVERRVAIKMILLGMDTEEVVARFEAERQALALMNHPNVATVLDAGSTPGGRPYFVMEYVPGVPITDYCDAHRLGIPERLDLFRQVCAGIQHAHQKGIIHRDIKPSNILVTTNENRPLVKVIDFGIAKAINQRLTERTVFTRFGQLIGTPEYMSPEQAGQAEDIDSRSDIYSLGVLLYELLVGRKPFDQRDLRRAGFEEICRIIREVDPDWPSTRLSGLGEESQAVAEARSTSLRTLARELHGDLDWITMKAMEKDRQRRYASASELAADLERFLRHEPVIAGPPGVPYRLKKFVTRHRGLVASGAAVAATLVIGIATTTWQAVLARRAEHAATENAQEAQRQGDIARRQLYLTCIAAACQAIEGGDPGDARALLERAPAEHRGWEWAYLDDRIDRSEAILAVPDGGPVLCLSMTRDGSLMAAGADGIQLWNPQTGTLVKAMANGGVPVNHVVFTPDGASLYGVDMRGVVRRWDTRTFDTTVLIESAFGFATALALTPDGARLVIAPDTGGLEVRDAVTGELSRTLIEEIVVTAAGLTADGDAIVAGDADGIIRVISITSGEVESSWPAHTGAVDAIAAGPSGSRVVSGGRDEPIEGDEKLLHSVRIWKLTDTETPTRSYGHAAAVNAVWFSPDGGLVGSASHDRTVALAAPDDEGGPVYLEGHPDKVYAVAFASDGASVFSGGMDGTIRRWSARPALYASSLPGLLPVLTDIAVTTDGRRVFSVGPTPRGVHAWDTASREPLDLVLDGDWHPMQCAMAAEGTRLIIGDRSGTLHAIDTETLTQIGRLNVSPVPVTSVAAANRRVVFGDRNGVVGLVDVSLTAPRTLHTFGQPVKAVAVDRYGSRIAMLELQDIPTRVAIARVVDVADNDRELWAEGLRGTPTCLALAPEGDRLAVGTRVGDVLLIDIDGGGDSPPVRLRGHDGPVEDIAFLPGGDRLCSGGDDNNINVWDLDRQDLTLVLRGHKGWVMGLAVRPPRDLMSISLDRTVRMWGTNE